MFWRILTASLVRQRRAKIVAFLTVAAGCAAVTGLAGLALDTGDQVMREMASSEANIVVSARAGDEPLSVGGVIVAGTPATIPVTSLAAIGTFFWRNNVIAYTPVLSTPALAHGVPVIVSGTWFTRTVEGASWMKGGIAHVEGALAVDGCWPSDDPRAAQALVGAALARRLGLARGETLQIDVNGGSHRITIAGLCHGVAAWDEAITVPIELLWQWTGRTSVVGHVLVQAIGTPETRLIEQLHKDPRSLPPAMFDQWVCTPYPSSIARRLEEAMPGTQARPIRRASQTQAAVVGRLSALLLAASLLALAVASLGVAGTLSAAVMARSQEVGLFKALGGSGAHVATLFLAEATVIALAGGLVGYVVGACVAHGTLLLVFGQGAWFKPALLPVALGLALLVTAAGSAAPLATILGLEPVRALRGE